MIYLFVGLSSFMAGMLFSCYCHCQFEGPDEEWCGCDGVGMAHVPGSAGFACGERQADSGKAGER